MTHYVFRSFSVTDSPEGKRCLLGGDLEVEFSDRLRAVLDELNSSYELAFPTRPPPILGLRREEWNGASGTWAQSEGDDGPKFMITVDTDLEPESVEPILAHELIHPIIRLQGVNGAQSLNDIDPRIGYEFSSTTQHPFLFHLMDSFSYGDEETRQYESSAEGELEKLSGADFAAPTYSAPPGQTWLALWYFNFFFRAKSHYQQIREVVRAGAPEIAHKLDILEGNWNQAWSTKKGKWVSASKEFQRRAMKKLDLEGCVGLTPKKQWEKFLFPQ